MKKASQKLHEKKIVGRRACSRRKNPTVLGKRGYEGVRPLFEKKLWGKPLPFFSRSKARARLLPSIEKRPPQKLHKMNCCKAEVFPAFTKQMRAAPRRNRLLQEQAPRLAPREEATSYMSCSIQAQEPPSMTAPMPIEKASVPSAAPRTFSFSQKVLKVKETFFKSFLEASFLKPRSWSRRIPPGKGANTLQKQKGRERDALPSGDAIWLIR